jgi:hypothetical protein
MARLNDKYIDALIEETLKEQCDMYIVRNESIECIKLLKYFANKIDLNG